MTDIGRASKLMLYTQAKQRANPYRYQLRVKAILDRFGVRNEMFALYHDPAGRSWLFSHQVWLDDTRIAAIEYFGAYWRKFRAGSDRPTVMRESGESIKNKRARKHKEDMGRTYHIPILWIRRGWIERVAKQDKLEIAIMRWLRLARMNYTLMTSREYYYT